MGLIIRNQQNNWAYVFIVLSLTLFVAGFVIFYAQQTIQEIEMLSELN